MLLIWGRAGGRVVRSRKHGESVEVTIWWGEISSLNDILNNSCSTMIMVGISFTGFFCSLAVFLLF